MTADIIPIRGRYYSTFEIERVRVGYARGEAPKRIAAVLGRSYKSVTVQAFRLRHGKVVVKLPRTPPGRAIYEPQTWITPAQDTRMAEAMAGRTF